MSAIRFLQGLVLHTLLICFLALHVPIILFLSYTELHYWMTKSGRRTFFSLVLAPETEVKGFVNQDSKPFQATKPKLARFLLIFFAA